MPSRSWAIILLASLLAACSSTQPSTAPFATTTRAPLQRVLPVPATPSALPASDGPVTSSMARLALNGERFATLGDPSAPLTLVEFSDFG